MSKTVGPLPPEPGNHATEFSVTLPGKPSATSLEFGIPVIHGPTLDWLCLESSKHRDYTSACSTNYIDLAQQTSQSDNSEKLSRYPFHDTLTQPQRCSEPVNGMYGEGTGVVAQTPASQAQVACSPMSSTGAPEFQGLPEHITEYIRRARNLVENQSYNNEQQHDDTNDQTVVADVESSHLSQRNHGISCNIKWSDIVSQPAKVQTRPYTPGGFPSRMRASAKDKKSRGSVKQKHGSEMKSPRGQVRVKNKNVFTIRGRKHPMRENFKGKGIPVTYCTNVTFDLKAKHKTHNVKSVDSGVYAMVLELNGFQSFIRRSAFHSQVCSTCLYL